MVTWQYLLKCFYLPFKNFAYFIPVVPGSRIDFKQAFYLEIPVNQEPIFFFFLSLSSTRILSSWFLLL